MRDPSLNFDRLALFLLLVDLNVLLDGPLVNATEEVTSGSVRIFSETTLKMISILKQRSTRPKAIYNLRRSIGKTIGSTFL